MEKLSIRFVCNAFSLNMLSSLTANVRCLEISEAAAASLYHESGTIPSAVGHADTANLFSTILGAEVKPARMTVSLVQGDRILVGQYSGPRLPEGATTLPEGASVKWVVVTIE